MLDQGLVLETAQQPALDQAVDLPRDQAQGRQQDQPEHAPALLLRGAIPEQVDDGRHQARQGKRQVGPQAHGIGHAGRQGGGANQAKHPGLMHEAVRGHQGNGRNGEGQATDRRAEHEHTAPHGLGLPAGHGRIKGRHLNHAHRHQGKQPEQPDAVQQVLIGVPQQPGADQAIDQHQQRRQQRTLIQQARALNRDFGCIVFTDDLCRGRRGAKQVGAKGHRRCSYNGEPETSTEHTQASAWAKLLQVIKNLLRLAANLWPRPLEQDTAWAAADDQPVIPPARMFAASVACRRFASTIRHWDLPRPPKAHRMRRCAMISLFC